LPPASAIYKLLADYIEAAGCSDIISPMLIEDFAFLRHSFLACEAFNKTHGRIANGKRSPYVAMAIEYQKAAQQIYMQVWSVISQIGKGVQDNKNAFLQLLQNRGF
jgi:hypothetical protein